MSNYQCTNRLETSEDVDYCLAHKCCVGGCKHFVWVDDDEEASE